MLVDSEEDKKIHRPFIPKDVSVLCVCVQVHVLLKKVVCYCNVFILYIYIEGCDADELIHIL